MADTAEPEPQDEADAEGSNTEPHPTDSQSTEGNTLLWIITVLVAVLSAGIGLSLGRLFAASRAPDQVGFRREHPLLATQSLKESPPATHSEKNWYWDMEPVTVNLDEPAFRHHVRASVTLEVCGELDTAKGRAFLEGKKTLLANRLTICLAGLKRDDIRGQGGIEKIRVQIRDAFNEELFADSKPRIKQVLFKHLAIQ